ncbi:MAG: ATPase domain-containing protein [Candidatus Thermoplasmatota archaeon]|nr:ATPase domain-containing protein [Candidatus Thermoplasmatota archaeon]
MIAEKLLGAKNFPPGTIVISGKTGAGKTMLALSIMCETILEGGNAAMITTDAPPDKLIETCKSIGFDAAGPLQNGTLHFLDCYSWRVGMSGQKERTGIESVGGMDNLNALAIKVEELLKTKPRVVVFDSVSTLNLHSEEKPVLRFLEVFSGRIRDIGSTAIIIVELGVQSNGFETILNSTSDGRIETKLDEGSGELVCCLRVAAMGNTRHSTKWTRFEITDKGIEFKEPDFPAPPLPAFFSR